MVLLTLCGFVSINEVCCSFATRSSRDEFYVFVTPLFLTASKCTSGGVNVNFLVSQFECLPCRYLAEDGIPLSEFLVRYFICWNKRQVFFVKAQVIHLCYVIFRIIDISIIVLCLAYLTQNDCVIDRAVISVITENRRIRGIRHTVEVLMEVLYTYIVCACVYVCERECIP